MSIELNSGYKMPIVGFGCWKVSKDTCSDQIYNAIKVGYRLFDSAMDYGNEKEVGAGLKRAMDDGLVSRDELFITSKLWNTYHAPEHVNLAIDRVLSDLGLDYIDLFLIHFPTAFKFVPFEERYPAGLYTGDGDKIHLANVPILDTWRAMEKLTTTGKVRSIGISNFASGLIGDLFRGAKIRPAVLQIEHHPYLQQQVLVDFVQREGLAITAYSSFGPQSFIELDHPLALKTAPLLEHETIKKIADAHKKTPAQVLLRWATQRNIAVIPKSNNPDRLHQNLHINEFDLTKEDLEEIKKLNVNLRFNNEAWGGLPLFD